MLEAAAAAAAAAAWLYHLEYNLPTCYLAWLSSIVQCFD